MQMTQKEAKELTLELWGYLAEHPECRFKYDVLVELWNKINRLRNSCPLCEAVLCGKAAFECGTGCPLAKAGENCFGYNSPWEKWSTTRLTSVRKTAATRIVEIVSAWEPEEQGNEKDNRESQS
jgi:hypothetical protein